MPEQLDALMGFLVGALQKPSSIIDDPNLADQCRHHVTGNARLSPAEQVDIYRRQFWLRHVDVLIDDYPGLHHILGDDAFRAFCKAYLAAYPPNSYTLRDLGTNVVRFADTYADFPEDKRNIAQEMARYENAFVDLFDGADPPPLDPTKLQSMSADDWNSARIVLHPLLVRMRFNYPVHKFRLEIKRTAAAELPSPQPVRLALFRKNLTVHYEELDPIADDLLDALGKGIPLVSACNAIAQQLDETAASELNGRIKIWFSQWTSWGLIVDIARDKGNDP